MSEVAPALLHMQDVNKTFSGTVTALHGMSLTVNEGDFISLLGPSGCGKSTALRLIAGLIHPTSGSIRWEGGQKAGDLGVVFQEPTLMPWATGRGECLAAVQAARTDSRFGARGYS